MTPGMDREALSVRMRVAVWGSCRWMYVGSMWEQVDKFEGAGDTAGTCPLELSLVEEALPQAYLAWGTNGCARKAL